MKTSELIGPALDWAVAMCEWAGRPARPYFINNTIQITNWIPGKIFSPSTDWAQGGPIIEREKITVIGYEDQWEAYINVGIYVDNYQGDWDNVGHTPLIAAMRCYCCAKLGDEVEIPEELL